MAGIEFKDVARLLSCEEFARREMTLHRGRARCPFHHGEHFNLAFYQRDGRCHCHVCGRTADVVQLASAVWNVSQMDAARMLNDDFNLGLTAEMPTNEQRQRRQREREAQAAAEQAARSERNAAADDLREAEQATAHIPIDDADKASTWAAVARLGAAQDRWYALQACAGGE